MAKTLRRALGGGVILLAVSLPAAPVHAQALQDTVVSISYFNVKQGQANAWVTLFKKHFHSPLEELREQGALLAWHLFVPGVHHPHTTWTHALALAYKDRAAQGAVETRVREIFAAMPAGDTEKLIGAVDRDKHFDDEWLEINLEAVEVPEEKKEEEKQE